MTGFGADQVGAVTRNDAPQIEFQETIHDFGFQLPKQAVTLRHDFKLRNTGNRDLIIKSLGTACWTDIFCPQRAIAPGEESLVRMTTVLSADYTTAELFSRVVKIETNDPAHPAIELQTKARFAYTLHWTPDKLEFGSMAAGEKVERLVQVNSLTSASFQVQKCECESKIFQPSVEQTTFTLAENGSSLAAESGHPRNQRTVIKIQAAPGAETQGGALDVLRIFTDRTDIPVIEIPISAIIVSNLTVEPASLFLGLIRSAEPVKRDINLVTSRPDLEILGVTCKLAGLSTQVLPRQSGYRIHLTYDPSRASGPIEDEVVIRTNASTSPEVKVPIQGLVKLAHKRQN